MINDNVNDNDIMNSQVNMTDIHNEEGKICYQIIRQMATPKSIHHNRTPNMLDNRQQKAQRPRYK